MYALTILALAGFAAIASALPPRIVGGNDAPLGKYPYQVSLRYYGFHFCGGSIINNRYILTAAHCLVSFGGVTEGITVHAGTNFLNETGDAYDVEELDPHAGFDMSAIVNDIGLLRVSQEIKFTDLVQPIELAKSNFAAGGHPCVVPGWGTTRLGGTPPNKLQELDLFVVSQEECKESHMDLENSHICTFVRYGQGLCHGDSGGPLVADGVQIGVVSFGEPCAIGYPDVFTRVFAFQDWLGEHVKND